jgi:N-acetylglucosamine-6-phosphate deacetylase
MHGAHGVDVMNGDAAEFQRMQRFLAARGVAHFLPTTVTAPHDFTLRALERMAEWIETGSEERLARPRGIHIEGPFLSHAKRGMHPTAALQPPSIELFDRMQQAARGHIRLITIAPEPNAVLAAARGQSFAQNTALELIQYATAKGIRCSIGHTNATATEALDAINAGATAATHTFNAMRALDHREPGVLGVVLDDERLYADLICDGIHVGAPAVRLWWKQKRPRRSILITDSLSATGMQQGEFVVGDATITVQDGRALVSVDLRAGKETLAGSVLTLDRAVRKLREFTGASLAEATAAGSHNPALMLGISEHTRIAQGSMANLTRWDEHGSLISTYLDGEEIRSEA